MSGAGEETQVEDTETGTDDANDAEARAFRQGWRPKEEYRGDPSKWVDAEEFLRRGEEQMPLLRQNNRELERKVSRAEQRLLEQNEVLQDMHKRLATADRRAYDRAKAELEAARESAVAAGDTEGFRRVSASIEELGPRPTEAPAPKQPAQPAGDPVVLDWLEENQWFKNDRTLNMRAVAEDAAVMEEHPEYSTEERLAEVKNRVMAAFPSKFPGQRSRTRAAAVAAPSAPMDRQRQRKSGLDSIENPAERAQAKAAFDKMRRWIPQMTEEEYMLSYDNPKADIMEYREQRRSKANGAGK